MSPKLRSSLVITFFVVAVFLFLTPPLCFCPSAHIAPAILFLVSAYFGSRWIRIASICFFLMCIVWGIKDYRNGHRAQILEVRMWLKEAHFDHEGYTNDSLGVTVVYPYTNQFTIDGTNYQCDFAAKSEVFRGRGFLAVTTNVIYVWVDEKRGVIPLIPPRLYPPGF
jgi:hypothetical protein